MTVRLPLRQDPTDDPLHGTELATVPAPYHLRLGRDRRVRLGRWRAGSHRSWFRAARMLSPSATWAPAWLAGQLGVTGRWATDLSLVLGPLVIRMWRVWRPSPEEVARHVAELEAVEVEAWAEAQGIILCRACREARRRACPHPDSPLCERMP